MPFQKGHPGFKPKGAKSKDTLIKEERRAIFDKRVSEIWETTIGKLRPEYVADQFMGKAPDKVEVEGKLVVEVSQEIITKYVPNTGPKSDIEGQTPIQSS